MKTNKTIIIGLDGATFRFIDEWTEQGELPGLEKLEQEGIKGTLRSTFPYLTSPAWPVFFTGKNPGKIGFFFLHQVREDYSNEPMNSSWYGGEFWSHIDGETTLINFPTTYPAKEIHGRIVAGPMAPGIDSDGFTHPPDLMEQLPDDYLIDPGHYSPSTADTYLENGLTMSEKTSELIRKLQKEDESIFGAVYTAPDRMQHHVYDREDDLKEIYQEADSMIQELAEDLDDDTVLLVMSDHGFCPSEKMFYPNLWLRQQGYLALDGEEAGDILPSRDRLRDILNRTGLIRLLRYVPASITSTVSEATAESATEELIDWENTECFVKGTVGHIYFNDERFEHGSSIEDYEEKREALMEKLKQIKDPETGETIVTDVWKREERYSGEHLEKAPDILYDVKSKYRLSSNVSGSKLFTKLETGQGFHEEDGIFYAYGGPIQQGKNVEGLELVDLAPTIIAWLKGELPNDMDGRVASDIFTEPLRIAYQDEFEV